MEVFAETDSLHATRLNSVYFARNLVFSLHFLLFAHDHVFASVNYRLRIQTQSPGDELVANWSGTIHNAGQIRSVFLLPTSASDPSNFRQALG